MKELPEGAESIVFECELEAPPAKVWRALTVPQYLERWLAPNDFEPEEGKRFSFYTPDADGGKVDCEVLTIDPERALAFSWQPEQGPRSEVEFVLLPTVQGGTLLRLVHSGFPLRFNIAMRGGVSCLARAA